MEVSATSVTGASCPVAHAGAHGSGRDGSRDVPDSSPAFGLDLARGWSLIATWSGWLFADFGCFASSDT